MLLLQHISVAHATYKTHGWRRSILRCLENDSGPEVGFEDIAIDLLEARLGAIVRSLLVRGLRISASPEMGKAAPVDTFGWLTRAHKADSQFSGV